MFSIYRSTQQGQQTRSQLLQHIQPGEELTREQLAARAKLTYDQVRRQTKNLCIDGVLKSRIEDGKRYYQLHKSFIPKIGTSCIALLFAWSVPVAMRRSNPDHAPEPSQAEHRSMDDRPTAHLA